MAQGDGKRVGGIKGERVLLLMQKGGDHVPYLFFGAGAIPHNREFHLTRRVPGDRNTARLGGKQADPPHMSELQRRLCITSRKCAFYGEFVWVIFPQQRRDFSENQEQPARERGLGAICYRSARQELNATS
jgi:hypothetical protein